MSQLSSIKYIKKILQIGLLFVITSLTAQQLKAPDSLLTKSYEVLDSLYYENEYTEKGKLYISTYLKKAKLESNVEETLAGYHHFADFYDNNYEIATAYIDSAIVLSEQKKFVNHRYPAVLYGKKGFIERIAGNFQNAVDYYLKELELLDVTKNSFNIKFVHYNIGLIKRDFGDLEGAKTILKKHLHFDETRLNENLDKQDGYLESYLYTIHELVRTYRLNKEIDSTRNLNDKGLKLTKNNELEYLFVLNDGIFDNYNNQYVKSIEKIISVLPKLKDKSDRYNFEIYNLVDAYFYLSQSYKELSKDEQKLFYYKKIDSLIERSNYLTPEIKLTYLELVEHYKQLGNTNKQLEYLDKFLHVDSILDTNYKYVNSKLDTDYDIPNLIKNKEALIRTLKNENVKTNKTKLIVSILLIISLFGLGFFYYNQRRYKKRFKALLAGNDEKIKEANTTIVNKKQALDISEDTITHIIESLNKFEIQEKYLKTNLTLDKVAKNFKTNSKYLSIVINNVKNKTVSQYINDLRINYAVNKLKQDSKFRKFTIKAIANDIGFNTDQAFSKAFYKKTGIYPSYFIKELDKQK